MLGRSSNDSPHVCICGRTFTQPGPLVFHQRSCKKVKSRFSHALDMGKAAWRSRKRRRIEVVEPESNEGRSVSNSNAGSGTPSGAECYTEVCLYVPSHVTTLTPLFFRLCIHIRNYPMPLASPTQPPQFKVGYGANQARPLR